MNNKGNLFAECFNSAVGAEGNRTLSFQMLTGLLIALPLSYAPATAIWRLAS